MSAGKAMDALAACLSAWGVLNAADPANHPRQPAQGGPVSTTTAELHTCEVWAETGTCPHLRPAIWARILDLVRESLAQTRSDFTKAW